VKRKKKKKKSSMGRGPTKRGRRGEKPPLRKGNNKKKNRKLRAKKPRGGKRALSTLERGGVWGGESISFPFSRGEGKNTRRERREETVLPTKGGKRRGGR